MNGITYLQLPYYYWHYFRIWADPQMEEQILPRPGVIEPYCYVTTRVPSTVYVESLGGPGWLAPSQLEFGFEPDVGYTGTFILYFYPIQAVIESTTPSYVAYGSGMQIDYTIYVTDDQHPFYGTPDSVKLYIKNGNTLINTINLSSTSGYLQNTTWDGNDVNGVHIGTGQYTLEVEVTKEGVKHSNKKNIIILKLDKV
jgi:hypothetical protein